MQARRHELLSVGATLALDTFAGELVAALRAAGVRAIVLKGPTIAQRLYDPGGRSHDDVDLLVSPADVARVETELQALGFRFAEASEHARAWTRRSDGVTVDLHTSLLGVGAPPELAWAELSAATEPVRLGPHEGEALARHALAMHIALHAAQHGVRAGKALSDLTLALERFPEELWREAAALAVRLDAVTAFATGLRLVTTGVELAARLELPTERSTEVALLAASAPPTALGLFKLSETHGLRAKANLVVRELAPSPPFMRALYPVARRGPLGLAAAYAWRPVYLLRHAVPAVRALRRARRDSTR